MLVPVQMAQRHIIITREDCRVDLICQADLQYLRVGTQGFLVPRPDKLMRHQDMTSRSAAGSRKYCGNTVGCGIQLFIGEESADIAKADKGHEVEGHRPFLVSHDKLFQLPRKSARDMDAM